MNGRILLEVERYKKWEVINVPDTTTINLPSNDIVKYSSLKLFHDTNNLVANEFHIGGLYGYSNIKTNLVILNLYGNVVDTIYVSNNGEFAGTGFISNDDSNILFSIEKDKNNTIDLNRNISLKVFNIKKKKLLYEIKDVGNHQNFEMNYPWSPDGKKIVYSISNRDKFMLLENEDVDNKLTNNNNKEDGIYIYDLLKADHDLVVPQGKRAAWSPNSNVIVYIKENNILLFNVDEKVNILLYKAKKKELIGDILWEPYGNYVFFTSLIKPFDLDFLSYNKFKVINVSTKKVSNFKNGKIKYNIFDWKK